MLIFLIGMMGSGKSTIGKKLANKLGYDFIDTDHLIEENYNGMIKDIINHKGIDYFRIIETNALRNLCVDINTIVSTGGGIVLNYDNIIFMKSNGTVIYLENSVESLANRLKKTSVESRPLLKDDLEGSLSNIYKERKELYEKASDIIINCDDLTIDETVIQIINKLV
ncbi:MAG: chorismate mutase [Haloplasmataceae bacterium]|jgi:shikimate kinase|nr:chorismate mutase [Haloplasmataceae bacterium]